VKIKKRKKKKKTKFGSISFDGFELIPDFSKIFSFEENENLNFL
jgi:hypothetical protein